MKRLLEEILLYAKPVNLDLRPIPISQVLTRFVGDHQDLAVPRNQSIVLNGANTEARIMADGDRLKQILLNLTQNACEAAPEGAEIVWTVSTDAAAGTVSLEVRNPGEPIPPDRLERLTEPFFSTKPAGTGLGLAIACRLTLVHGGELSISSDAVSGTVVQLLFPRHERPEQPGPKSPSQAKEAS